MKYINAHAILPDMLVEELQKYIQAGYIYIPHDEADWAVKHKIKTQVRWNFERISSNICGTTPQLHQFWDVFPKRSLTKRCGVRIE